MEDSDIIKEKNRLIIKNLVLLYGLTKELQLKSSLMFGSLAGCYLINGEWINKYKQLYNYEQIVDLLKQYNYNYDEYESYINNINTIVDKVISSKNLNFQSKSENKLKDGTIYFSPNLNNGDDLYLVNYDLYNKFYNNSSKIVCMRIPINFEFNNEQVFFIHEDNIGIGEINKDGMIILQYNIQINKINKKNSTLILDRIIKEGGIEKFISNRKKEKIEDNKRYIEYYINNETFKYSIRYFNKKLLNEKKSDTKKDIQSNNISKEKIIIKKEEEDTKKEKNDLKSNKKIIKKETLDFQTNKSNNNQNEFKNNINKHLLNNFFNKTNKRPNSSYKNKNNNIKINQNNPKNLQMSNEFNDLMQKSIDIKNYLQDDKKENRNCFSSEKTKNTEQRNIPKIFKNINLNSIDKIDNIINNKNERYIKDECINSELKEKIKKLEKELDKEKDKNKELNKIIDDLKENNANLKKQLSIEIDKNKKENHYELIKNNNTDNLIELTVEKEKIIKELKEKLSFYPFELNKGEKLISLIIITPEQNYVPIVCKNTYKFFKVEEILYEKYDKYKNMENYFLIQGKKILKYLDLDSNNIKDGDIIQMYQIESE